MEFEGGGGEKEGSSLLTQYETKGAAWKSVLIVAAGLTTVCVCVLGGAFTLFTVSTLIYWRKILVFGVVFIEQASEDSFTVVFCEIHTREETDQARRYIQNKHLNILYSLSGCLNEPFKVDCPGCRSRFPFISGISSEQEQLHGKLEANHG